MNGFVRMSAFLLALAVALPAMADDKTIEETMGKADAPVTIIEYASLTCPHCAAFDVEVLPKIKEKWIDTGKAKLVFRDFPLDPMALGAAMVAHCAGPQRYFGFLDAFFRTQTTWARAANPAQALAQVAKLGGMGEKQFDECLNDGALRARILATQEEAQKKYEVSSTPSFVVDGKLISGSRTFDEFDQLLAKAKQ